MFYEHIILAKKGPLARVWLAAHWDKKITKAHVFETNIEKSVEGILQPKVKLALRTSGHLLLGVVRIYSRKAKYLLADCNEAFVKIKMAFRPGMVDLPEGHREANVNAITLPEVFHDFDTALPELNDIDIEAQFTINQSRADEITMREDYGSLSLSLHDDGFGDLGFEGDTPDIMRGSLDGDINDHLLEDNRNLTDNTDPIITLNEADIENPQLGDVDGFGDDFGHDLFAEPPQINLQSSKENLLNTETSDIEDNADHFDNNMPSPHTTCGDIPETLENDEQRAISEILINHKALEEGNLDQSTLIQNEDEGFALAPIDASAFKGVTKAKRKRKLIVDEIKNISGEEMKAQLANTTDIVTTLDLAPPTKRWLMYWKETGGVEKLFSLPSKRISARVLFANYNRHLLSHFTHLEDFSCLGPTDILGLDQYATENESIIQNNKRGRKRKGEISLQETEIQPETHQSLSMPDTIRDQNNLTSSTQISLEVGADHESMVPVGNVSLYDNLQSPAPVFSLNDINSLDNLQSLNDLPVTPSNLHNVVDSTDDFHHGDHTPAELLHGQVTPRHESMEHLEGTQNVYSTHNAELDLDILDDAHETTLKPNNKSLEIESDWNEFDFNVLPGSQTTGVEQMENETDEQFEERVLNKRAAQLFYAIKSRMDHSNQDILFLSHMTIKNSRKQAAQKFYSLLVLKKFKAISIKQSAAYSDICIERGPLFENPKL